MVPESLLELFDAQVRRPNRPDGFYVSKGWSAVLRPPPDGNVEPLVARMRELPGWVEWKYYSHDLPPDLPERLVAAGLEPEDEETVVVAEAASIPPPSPDRKSTRLNSSHRTISYAVFCLKKKKNNKNKKNTKKKNKKPTKKKQ